MTNEIKLYHPIYSGIFYNQFINILKILYNIIQKNEVEKKYYKLNFIYPYILITYIYFIKEQKLLHHNINKIIKYNPITYNFYEANEIINSFFNIKDFNNQSILQIGNSFSFIEVLNYINYKIKDIIIINLLKYTLIENKENELKQLKDYENKFKTVYDIKVINFEKIIYKIFDIKHENKKDLIIINNIFYEKNIFNFDVEELQNFLLKIVEVIYALQNLNENGSLIINFNTILFQQSADLFVWLKRNFKEAHLYYPEISNQYKRTGTFAIFKGYKEPSQKEMNILLDYLKEIEKEYPNNVYDFNIYDKFLRNEYFEITKEIKEIKKPLKGLNLNLKDQSDYQQIIDFNNQKYFKSLNFTKEFIKILEIPEKDLPKLPTQEQITSSIMYCKKWGIDYYPYYDSKVMRDKMGEEILNEMYGNIEPINYKFKTPHTTKTPTKLSVGKIKITLSKIKNPKLSYLQSTSTSTTKSISGKTKIKPFPGTLQGGFKKLSKKLSKKTFKKTFKKQNKQKEYKLKSEKVKEFKTKMSIMDNMFDVNNQISQTGYMIDSRRDFEVKDYNLQLPKYFRANVEFRYYKARGDDYKYDLTQMVRSKIHRNVSQAWLKFYEILSETNIINKNNKSFKSFHLCEAPGSFIDCLAYYLRKETNITKFEWNAQSYKQTKGKTYFGDDFNLIKQNPNNWKWGADGDGDITSCNNILSYKPLADDVELITSDCGIPMGTPGYEKIVFSSMVAITYLLPLNGNMIFKILTPIETPIIWNIIYLWFNNFKELRFFKPIQNAQSREFYIIGKGYLGTDKKTVDLLLELVKDKTDKFEKIDLFDDKYPENFVLQLLDISKKLADNWCFTIQKQIYYSDNLEYLDKSFYKNAKDYIQEKNLDFIEKYNLIPLKKF